MKILPDFIMPMKMARNNTHLVGVIPFHKMSNCHGYQMDNHANVQVDIAFGMLSKGLRYIKGSINTKLKLKCERCLEYYVEHYDIDLNLAMVMTESQGDNVPTAYDVIIVKEQMKLIDIIEHELLLHLPMIAKHPKEDCSSFLNSIKQDKQQNQPPKLLAELAKLKGKL